MKLVINNDCCSCSYCYRACPVGAPYYDGEQTRIDQGKCISCLDRAIDISQRAYDRENC